MSLTITKLEDGNTRLCVPLEFRYDNGCKRLFFSDIPVSELEINASLATGIARGYRWQELLDDGEFASPEALATALGVNAMSDDNCATRCWRRKSSKRSSTVPHHGHFR